MPTQGKAVSGLENTVMAEQVANVSKKEELDLTHPENPVKYFFEALNMPNAVEGHNLYMRVSRDKEFRDYGKWERDRRKIKSVSFDLSNVEKLSVGRCLVLGEGIIVNADGNKIRKQVKMHTIYNGSEWMLEDK